LPLVSCTAIGSTGWLPLVSGTAIGSTGWLTLVTGTAIGSTGWLPLVSGTAIGSTDVESETTYYMSNCPQRIGSCVHTIQEKCSK